VRREPLTTVPKSAPANCALRYEALAQTRAAFDPEVFDRFLYVAVAPTLCSSGDSDRAMLRWISRGCP
jgi:hypothetical protein